jgi:hypothetical protein
MSKSRVSSTKLAYLTLGCVFLATVIYVLAVLPGRSAQPAALPTPSPSYVPHSDGLSDSFEGFVMRPVALPTDRGTGLPVAFQITGPDGQPFEAYETVQTKELHLYAVRDDVSGYQHLHPERRDGTWHTTMDIPDGGAYRVYAEFNPRGRAPYGSPDWHPVILGLHFIIAGDTKVVPLPGPAATVQAGKYTVSRKDGISHLRVNEGALLSFDVPGAKLEQHLGAIAHMSGFEVRTMSLNHLHPAADQLTFHVQFPNRGEYRLFLEFKADGQVHRADFTIFVT